MSFGGGTFSGVLKLPNWPRPCTGAPAAWTTFDGNRWKLTHTLSAPTAIDGWSALTASTPSGLTRFDGPVLSPTPTGGGDGTSSATFVNVRPPSADTATGTLPLVLRR